MIFLCSDGYYCCDADCSNGSAPSGGSSSSSSICDNCMLVGDYYVHAQNSVPPGCDENSNIQINLTRNDYDNCDGDPTFLIKEYDTEYLANVSINDVNGATSVYAQIIKKIPHGTYTTIVYEVTCPTTGNKIWGQIHLASKDLCLECETPNTCDECTGDCTEIDLGVS